MPIPSPWLPPLLLIPTALLLVAITWRYDHTQTQWPLAVGRPARRCLYHRARLLRSSLMANYLSAGCLLVASLALDPTLTLLTWAGVACSLFSVLNLLREGRLSLHLLRDQINQADPEPQSRRPAGRL